MRAATMMLITMAGAACATGGSGFDNVAACDETLANFSCGDVDFAALIDCSAFADRTCDLTTYFDCLTDNFVCEEAASPAFDVSNWETCAEMTVCPSS